MFLGEEIIVEKKYSAVLMKNLVSNISMFYCIWQIPVFLNNSY